MALKTMPPGTPRQDHGRASSHLPARNHATYSNERYENNTLPVGTPDSLTTNPRRINAVLH
jgi:hypothetical protein